MGCIVYKAKKYDLGEEFTIGRDKKSDLVITEGTVSRHHAVFKLIGDNYYIIDVGSSNGTYKDAELIKTPTLVTNRTVVQCGNAQIMFYERDKEEAINDDEDEDGTMLTDSSNYIVESIVMVADIKGYTSFSENTSIKKVSQIMAKWLKMVNSIIKHSQGHIDSFIGDCVYARWDEKTDKKTLQNVLKVVKHISDETREIASLDIGVGINIGEVIIGAETNNTGLGDTINTTFRLEGATRKLNTDILVSQRVAQTLELKKEFIDLDLKGKEAVQKVIPISFSEIHSIVS